MFARSPRRDRGSKATAASLSVPIAVASSPSSIPKKPPTESFQYGNVSSLWIHGYRLVGWLLSRGSKATRLPELLRPALRCCRGGEHLLRHLLRHNFVWAHHVVVLVLQDVAVPDILPSDVEVRLDPGDLCRVRSDGVLPPALIGGWPNRRPGELNLFC